MSQATVIQQYVYETESWGRHLAFFLQENISFKIRLTEILTNTSEPADLETAEKFQEQFLSQDRIIIFLKDELQQQTKLLERDLYEDGEIFKEVIKNQKKMRKDMKKIELLFANLKRDFSAYLENNSSS